MNKAITSEKYNKLNLIFKERRLALGLSMRDLGEIIKEPHSFVQKVEANQRKLDIFQYVQYCEALEMNPAETLKILMKKSK
ncbi:MAG: helix-turn-helix transcriptional regulator [Oleispira sp.]|jgi:ribosome-binding protein aMBF1 (putative translation factor)|nr:helix-turn-helix transcriptional regulator [Oleispira sp.]